MIVYSCSASSRMYGSLIHSRMSGMSPSHADGLPLLKPRRPLCARARFPEPSVVEGSGARSGGNDRLCSQCRFCVLACLPCRLRSACKLPPPPSEPPSAKPKGQSCLPPACAARETGRQKQPERECKRIDSSSCGHLTSSRLVLLRVSMLTPSPLLEGGEKRSLPGSGRVETHPQALRSEPRN